MVMPVAATLMLTVHAAGLSVAEIVTVAGDVLTLAGVDVVDGTPVLDVKPYLPFADSVPRAVAPPWVSRILA